MLSKFRLHRRVRRIEYEALHLICFKCGRYGHRRDKCSEGIRVQLHNPDQLGPVTDEGGPKKKIPEKEIAINPEITETYGQWMLASKNNRGRNG